MGSLNHALDRGREPLSREGDLRIMCTPPLELFVFFLFYSSILVLLYAALC